MEATQESAVTEYRESRAIRLMPGPRELAAIAAFWFGYGLLTIANRFFDTDGAPPGELASRITIALIEALLWTIITPILFAIAGRVDLDNTSRRRAAGMVVLVLSTVIAAALLAIIGRELRE